MTQDPNILLSVINTWLRDEYASLDDLCASKDIDEEEVRSKLLGIGFEYDPELNRFTQKQNT